MSDSYVEHNNNVRNQYWIEHKKSGQDSSLACCYGAIVRPRTLGDKLGMCKNSLYVMNTDERREALNKIVLIFFKDEIKFIFENRRIIREYKNLETISFSGHELFYWMKKNNSRRYEQFKIEISNILAFFASKGTYSKNDIEIGIADRISKFLGNYYLKL